MKDMSELRSKLESVAMEDVDYFGVASVDRFVSAPEGRKPNDLLNTCRSVISLGIKIGKGAIHANNLAYRRDGLRHGIYIYMAYGYVILNNVLDRTALRLSSILEREGFMSVPIPASAPADIGGFMGAVSNRHAAVAAGLGEMGWNALLITPEAGPRVRVVTVLTEAELVPDEMYSGEQLCNKDKCRVCIKACPMDAIPEEDFVEVDFGDKGFRYANIDKVKCLFGVDGLSKKTLGRIELTPPGHLTIDDVAEASKRVDPWQSREKIASMCGRCIIRCPVGKNM